MYKLKFKNWFEQRDIFGFEQEVADAQNAKNKAQQDELPIIQFDLDRLMNRLAKNSVPGSPPATSRFITEMQWGSQPGSVRVVFTPKLNVKIQRLHHDKEGSPVWLMKRFFFVNDKDFGGQEDIVADEVFEQVKMVAQQPLDHVPQEKGWNLEEVAFSLAAKLRRGDYNVIDYDTIRKINENEYDLLFHIRGGGRGNLFGPRTHRPVLALIVKLGYNEHTGCIKAIGQMVSSEDDPTTWEIQPADFEELYFPSQPKHEIIETIVTSLKWF